jgi:hypothetical protein
MTTTLDLRGDYARLNPPCDLPPLEFDLTGAHALVGAIKPVTDGMRSAGMNASAMFTEARIRVIGSACNIAMLKGDGAAARAIWGDYKAAHAARSPEVVAEMERRMGVRQ